MQKEIDLPLLDDIKAEHRALYVPNGNMSLVATKGGMSASTLSRHMNVDEDVKDHIWETIAEMIGAVKSRQPQIGKGLFGMIHRHAVELGLVDEKPIDILKQAIASLRTITDEDLRRMSPEERFEIRGHAAELEVLASGIKTDAILMHSPEGRGRNIELGGDGVRDSLLGSRRS
jgi:hypothetical protein